MVRVALKVETIEEFYISPCANCGIRFGIPVEFEKERRADKREFYCPNGHTLSWTTSEADRLKTQLQAAQQAVRDAEERAAREERWRMHANEQTRTLEKRLSAQRGVTTRLKNRVANGVCPCCNRTFMNLQRHMATKHKGFVAEEVQDDTGQAVH